jgi:hypothetical protein
MANRALPDLLAVIREIAFDGSDAAEMSVALRVLQEATQRLNDHRAAAASQASPERPAT